MRKVVFGEKAYLPMTLHGGCLSETDVENLKLGHFCILPPDNYGRAVLYECRGHLDDTGLNYASLVSHSGDSGLDSEEKKSISLILVLYFLFYFYSYGLNYT